MSKIVVDADGLIKVGKSGALRALLGAAEVLVPRAVWVEAVEEGKRRMYEDAHVLERTLTVGPGGAEVIEAEEAGGVEEAEELLRSSAAFFGAGERATLAAFFGRGADAVLTDDRAFLGLLRDAGLPALVPTAAIVALAAEARALSVAEAKGALERIEGSVRSVAYEAAMGELEEMARTEAEER